MGLAGLVATALLIGGCYTGLGDASGAAFGANPSGAAGASEDGSGGDESVGDPTIGPADEESSGGWEPEGSTGSDDPDGPDGPDDPDDPDEPVDPVDPVDPTGGVCGDGVVDASEACDLGADNGKGSTCTDVCEANVCGDGILGPAESCDDGNLEGSDGCSPTCALESCGDGVVNLGEACDDGNASNADACTTSCQAAACGDGFVQAGEACDDGNNNNEDACSNGCVSQHGDGIPISGYCTPVRNAVWNNGWESLEAQVITLTNQARATGRNCGGTFYPAAPPVTYEGSLTCSARNHSRDMAQNAFFSHTGSGGTTPAQRIDLAGYEGPAHAENITAGGALNLAQEAVDQWIASPSHCAAMMSPNLDELGVGYYRLDSAPHVHYWTQNFGG